MTMQKILLPYNFTSYDKKALDFVIETFADRPKAELTLFNAYIPAPQVEVRQNPVMEKMAASAGYFLQRIQEQEDELQAAKQSLLMGGFTEKRIRIVFQPKKKHIAADIIDLILKNRFDVVVLNRKPGKISRLFTKTAFSKIVTTLSDTTICIVS